MMAKWSWWMGLGLAVLAAAGCGGGEDDPGLCEPNAREACACPGQAEGERRCAADGLSWSACDCPCLPACDGRACGADGCGGSCGRCTSPPAATCPDDHSRRWYEATGSCRDGACSYTAHIEPCSFGCAEGACLPDPCAALRCDSPPGPCHAAAGSCVREPEPHCVYQALADGTDCSDSLVCNGAETCQAGACAGGATPDCSHLDSACQLGRCSEAAGGCTTAPRTDGTPCDDGLFCNGAETCQAGACQPGTAVDCSHLDSICADGDCSEGLRRCVARPKNEGTSCADDLVCNGHETCRNGECASAAAITCEQPAEPCLEARCDEASGGCVTLPLVDDTPCDDGDDCTLGDACLAGSCLSGAVAADGTPCDDGDACTTGDSCQQGVCTPSEQICDGQVVLLMYLAADNNLDDFLTADWHEMEAAGVDAVPWMRVFVVIDHYGTNDAHFYEVHDGSSQELDAPHLGLTVAGGEELNMADGQTVVQFIQDVRAIVGSEPAAYLVVSDHGDGWRRQASAAAPAGPVYKGTCSDDHGAPPGDMLFTRELGQALAGQDLQLVAFDACLEAMIEVAYELRDRSLVMVASQELEPGEGWQFTDLLSQFGQADGPNPARFGEIAVETYIDSYPAGYDDITLSALDLTAVAALAAATDAVAGELASLDAGAWSAICADVTWYGCSWFGCEDFADLGQLAALAREHDDRPNDAVYDALLDALAATVIHHRHRASHPEATGLNVYFPCAGAPSGEYSDAHLQWAADTIWDEMLDR